MNAGTAGTLGHRYGNRALPAFIEFYRHSIAPPDAGTRRAATSREHAEVDRVRRSMDNRRDIA
jgi:hypothetical protein